MKANLLSNKSVKQIEIIKVRESNSFPYTDDISVEEPLEIRVSYSAEGKKESKNISVTMRTPGNDAEFAAGFLFTEGIISGREQIKSIYSPQAECSRNSENVVIVELTEGFVPELMKADRNFYTTSSCGVCGKGSIESIRTVSAFHNHTKENTEVSLETLYQLSEKLQSFQNNFSATGGIHASGIFDLEGNLLALREDVGRHNALDKLIGYALSAGLLPLNNKILLLSGRASFELIQKAAMAGISIVAAIGAPSSLAVDLAKEFDITLLGFLRDNRFNIYHSGSHFNIENLL
ncbi:formate dehydrogenase accessory protein [Chryseobacterium gleum]|uniref:Sulfur carrier protein FdhD n=2 Tax=Chryseobacterium gleum TaxID=250 RepID=A0A3S4MT38_CHRGE|nr:formate dehydrogenase accessory sulfurtransferase FdhD [Chryseobacterium gleum]EFK36181.1 formate dehydrogenase family accessory protein FdhD [Chryseobacterium gleum ATCC 35910]QQY31875.1 formate dehydrogenase accessory sulfurtransferase FdhD [Chryseobacterium gleum]VEE10972.1 formate dehydrogenase accessory protein [Chryseobacterium gleum]